MLKINYMSTLFVGIDVSSKTNAVYAMDFEENKYLSSSFGNNQPGADKLVNMIAECMHKHKNLDTLLIVLESTSVYSVACIFQTSCRPARFSCPKSLMSSVSTQRLLRITASPISEWKRPILQMHTSLRTLPG